MNNDRQYPWRMNGVAYTVDFAVNPSIVVDFQARLFFYTLFQGKLPNYFKINYYMGIYLLICHFYKLDLPTSGEWLLKENS